MKTFFIMFQGKKPEKLTRKIYYDHIDHLKMLNESHVLVLAGPLLNQDKVIQIIRADNIDDAKAMVEKDPYINQGYYVSFDCYEWVEVNADNNWLMDSPRIKEMLKNIK